MAFKVTGFSESEDCPDYPVTVEGVNTVRYPDTGDANRGHHDLNVHIVCGCVVLKF